LLAYLFIDSFTTHDSRVICRLHVDKIERVRLTVMIKMLKITNKMVK